MTGTLTRRQVLRGLAASTGLLLAAACAPASPAAPAGSGAPAGSAATSAPAPVDPITIAVFAVNPLFGHVYVAAAEGYFEREQVQVKILDATAANTLNLVLSGQADLGMIGATSALLPVKEGKETSIIFAHIGNANGGVVVAKKGITSLAQVKRMGATTPGTSSYGFATFYKNKQNATYDIVPMQDVQTMRAALASGSVEAATNAYVIFEEMIREGQVDVLIDTRDPAARRTWVGEDYPEAAIFGQTDVVTAKTASLTRFMRAIGSANTFVRDSSPEAIAASLRKLPVFQAIPETTLTPQVVSSKPYYAPNNGYISADVWKFAITQYQAWGVAIDPNDPAFSYERRVNMKIYESALGKPSG